MSITPTERRLLVSIREQQMALMRGAKPLELFPVSTSKNPPSCRADSFGTPWGLHQIADCIGGDAPEGMVFKGRVATGKRYTELDATANEANLITSRILRLRGLENGHNCGPGCDSYERYIYIHGSNHEDRIGRPFSGGCIEMLNRDVIRLFHQVQSGDLVWIAP